MNKRQEERPYSSDQMGRKIASCLARDFRQFIPDSAGTGNLTSVFESGSVADIRSVDYGVGSADGAYAFKARHQLQDLFKKFRFEHDLNTEAELAVAAEKQFMDNQDRLGHIATEGHPMYLRWILFTARGLCHQILGDYDLEEHINSCRFGKKSSVGVRMTKACEGERYRLPITGSAAHCNWFEGVYLPEDQPASMYLSDAVRTGPIKEPFMHVEALALTLVPKTYKSLRSIMPNTTIGSFYTDGLGKCISRRLKRAGYDISTLQEQHGELARIGSITGELVTADQSLASDNITLELVRQILPRTWFDALNLGRLDQVKLPSGRTVVMRTFCTMGIGFTFPLQTLIFLVLLKALEEIYMKKPGTISVYGDDMIYPTQLHPFVVLAFGKLGLKLNLDKTYASGSFRESCGQDYFAGVDVRPFQLKNGWGFWLSRSEYETALYAAVNGIQRRWSREEVPLTFDFLLSELDRVTKNGICRVPSGFPDQSGVRCSSPYDGLGKAFRLSPIKFGKHGSITFKYVRFVPDVQKEARHAPYLWRKLGCGPNDSDRFDHHRHDRRPLLDRCDRPVLKRIEDLCGITGTGTEVFSYPQCPTQRERVRGIKTSKPPRSEATSCIPKPGGAGRLVEQTSTTVSWC